MKGNGKPHAPKTGVGYSDGKKPPAVAPGVRAHPKAGAGRNSGMDRSGDKGSSHAGSGKSAAGDMAAMRRPYK